MRNIWATTLVLAVMTLGSCQSTPAGDHSPNAQGTVSPPSTTNRVTTTEAPDQPATTTPPTEAVAPSTTPTGPPTTTAAATTTTTPPTTSTAAPTATTTTTTHLPTTTTSPPRTTTSTTTGATEARDPSEEDPEEGFSTHPVSVTTVEFMPGLRADVHAPAPPGNYPVVALVFGGGWAVGDRTRLSPLAHKLASTGMVVVNGEHRTLLGGRRLPAMLGEMDCLAAAAPHLAAPHLSGPAAPVWLMGFSSGAHLAAVSALTDSPPPRDCAYGSPDVAGMIGLAGPYDLDELWNEGILTNLLDSDTIQQHFPELAVFLREQNRAAMQLFLRLLTGTTPDLGDTWNAFNPIHLAQHQPERSFLLITGARDQVVSPIHASRFAQALTTGGHRVLTHTITAADHVALTDPGTVGDVVVNFLTEESNLLTGSESP